MTTTRGKLAAVLLKHYARPGAPEFAAFDALDALCAIVEAERDAAIEECAKAVELASMSGMTHGLQYSVNLRPLANEIRALKKAGGR